MLGTVLDTGDVAVCSKQTSFLVSSCPCRSESPGSSAIAKRGDYFSHMQRPEIVLRLYRAWGTPAPSLFPPFQTQPVAFILQVTKENAPLPADLEAFILSKLFMEV